MALKVAFDKQVSIQEQMQVSMQAEEAVIRAMQFAGESFVRDARNMTKSEGGFGDVTGNLRGSISYYILKNGNIIVSNLKGSAIGKAISQEQLNLIPKKVGLQLIGIVGMNYASHVESRGYNVITIQAEQALIDLSGYYKDIERRFK